MGLLGIPWGPSGGSWWSLGVPRGPGSNRTHAAKRLNKNPWGQKQEQTPHKQKQHSEEGEHARQQASI